jgi:uncharacterized phage protein gp47/JayE
MSTEYEVLMQKAGIPTTDEAIENRFKQVADGVGTDLNNDDLYSPFWSLLKSLCVYPATLLINFIHSTVLPNLFIQDAVDEWLDRRGWEYKTPRKTEEKAKGFIKFRRLSGSGTQTVPVGTVIQSNPVGGVVYKLVTLADSVFNDGDIEIAVMCQALEAGAGHNLAAGFYTVLPESIPGIKNVFNDDDWLVVNGADRETNDDYRLRLRDLFSSLNHYHVDEVYRSIITSFAGISPNNVFFDKNVPRGPGSADALILMDHGSVGTQLLISINQHINDKGNHGLGDDMLVRAIDTVDVDLNIDIYVDPAFSQTEKDSLKLQFENYVRAGFRQVSGEEFKNAPNKVEPFKRFSFSRLGSQAHKEFSGLVSIDFNRDDIVHSLNVSDIGTLTVSMFDAD